MKIDIALEWFLNPDHLPFIAGIELGWFAEAGLVVSLKVPEDHYDGLAAVVSGEIAFACNEPLHMIDAHRPGLKALGCFFETDGGILLQPSGAERLLAGEGIRVASPVAGEITDEIAIEILARWCHLRGASFERDQVVIEAAGFEHLKNLQAGYDAAWLCFANFEGVEARMLGVEAEFVATGEVGLENFSALELFTGERFLAEHRNVVDTVLALVSRGTELCRNDPEEAARLWYAFSGDTPEPLMDEIIRDTCPRLVAPVVRDAERWRAMWRQFESMGMSQVDATAYDRLYAD